MDENEINYRNLRHIQQLEKKSPLLTRIDPDFYSKLARYLDRLDKTLREAEAQKSSILIDEIQNTRRVANSIYEFREKKIVQAALSTARGGKPDLKNLLDEEKTLYNALVDIIMEARKKIFNKEKMETADSNETVTGNKNHDSIDNKYDYVNVKNVNPIVRITQDIPEFIGIDTKKYLLKKEDVLTLPKEMSKTLIERGVAKQIKQ